MPRHCSDDSPPLCDTVRYGQQPPCGTVPPTLVRPTHHPLEKGRRNPRREDARLLLARTGRCRDVRIVGAVTSVAISPVRPSPPPRRHPGHCITIPDAVEACGDGTPPRWPLCLVRPCCPCAAARRRPLRQNQAPQSSTGTPSHRLVPLDGQLRRPLAGGELPCAAGTPVQRFHFCRVLCAKGKGRFVRFKKFQGVLREMILTPCCVSAANCKIHIKSQKNPKITNPILLCSV
jgi:hypothetical protein